MEVANCPEKDVLSRRILSGEHIAQSREMLKEWGTTRASPCAPCPEKEQPNASRAPMRLRVTEA